jgi:putative membrane protein
MTVSRWIRCALLGALPLVAVVGCAKEQEGVTAKTPPPATTMPSDVTAAVSKLPEPDRSFVKGVGSANMAAIRFGQLAQQRGSTDKVRDLASKLVDSNTELADKLRETAREQGVVLPVPPMSTEQQQTYMKLSTLTGPEFDRAYMDSIVGLQDQTLQMFQNEAMNGQTPDLREFANRALPDLNERARMVRREMGLM